MEERRKSRAERGRGGEVDEMFVCGVGTWLE